MKYLKFYKPIFALKFLIKTKNTELLFKHDKHTKNKRIFNKININILPFNQKICFFTFKYKTQINFLKQSRFTFLNNLTFNRNHTFVKYTH